MTRPGAKNRSARFAAVVVRLLSAWAFAAGIVQLILRINGLPLDPVRHSAVILLLIILAAGLTWTRYQLIASGFLIAAAGFAWVYSQPLRLLWQRIEPDIRQFSQDWVVEWLSGRRQPDARFELWLIWLVMSLIALLSYGLIARFNWPLAGAIALIVIAELLLSVRPEPALDVLWSEKTWLLFPLASVIAGFAQQSRSLRRLERRQKGPLKARLMLQAIPLALVIILLTVWLLPHIPATTFYSHRMEGLVDDVVSQTGGGQANIDQYQILDISRAGYHSLFDRLGGPVQLSDNPIFRISGYSSPMLLRTAVAGDYDGTRWLRSRDLSLLRFGSEIYRKETDHVFDLSRPPYSELTADFLEPIEYRISPVGQSLHSIPLGGRPLDVRFESEGRYQYLFSRNGQLLSKYWLNSGEIVQIEALRLRTGSLEFATLVRQLGRQLSDQEYAGQIRHQLEYLTLPALPEYSDRGELTLLTAEIIAPYSEPWDRVMAIRGFLLDFASYDLDVEVPLDDAEFVSWFLQTRRGYCVYFATAMTMMSRLAGIPARYVEGFYSPDAAASWRLITGQQAHAWTEVFMPGAGWIPVDATPGFSADPWEPLIPGEPADPVIATPLPGPVSEPVVSPSVTDHPQRPGAGLASRRFLIGSWPVLLWLAILILILILARLMLVSRKRHQRDWIEARLPDKSERAAYYRSQIEQLLRLLGRERRQGESQRSWLTQLAEDYDVLSGKKEGLVQLGEQIEYLIYSGQPADTQRVEKLADWFDTLEELYKQRSAVISRIAYRMLRPDRLFFRWNRPSALG